MLKEQLFYFGTLWWNVILIIDLVTSMKYFEHSGFYLASVWRNHLEYSDWLRLTHLNMSSSCELTRTPNSHSTEKPRRRLQGLKKETRLIRQEKLQSWALGNYLGRNIGRIGTRITHRPPLCWKMAASLKCDSVWRQLPPICGILSFAFLVLTVPGM